jgi:hypothetical protein
MMPTRTSDMPMALQDTAGRRTTLSYATMSDGRQFVDGTALIVAAGGARRTAGPLPGELNIRIIHHGGRR